MGGAKKKEYRSMHLIKKLYIIFLIKIPKTTILGLK